MIATINEYVDLIADFQDLSNLEQVKYIAYFFLKVNNVQTLKSSDIINSFDELHLKIPINIPHIVLSNTKGARPFFIKKGVGVYALHRDTFKELDTHFGLISKNIAPSSNLFPIEIVKNTRGYIEKVAIQAIVCYDYEQYDASLVMLRKLLETLIIEIYEKYGLAQTIKDIDGNFYMLGSLIDKLLSDNNWNLGRTTKQFLPHIKKLADTSAHNRRFIAKKPDIDRYKNEIRMVIEELVHIANF